MVYHCRAMSNLFDALYWHMPRTQEDPPEALKRATGEQHRIKNPGLQRPGESFELLQPGHTIGPSNRQHT